MSRRQWRPVAAPLVVLVVAVAVASCSGDDDRSATGSVRQPAEDGSRRSADVEAYCEASLRFQTIPEPDIDVESLSREEQAEAVREFATRELRPLAGDIEAAAPEEISGDMATLVDAVDDVAETGSFDAFEEPEVDAADRRVHRFELQSCGWTRVDVTAVDYGFEGIPAAIEAGPVSFDLTNTGEEFHEIGLARKNDGVTDPAVEILRLPQDQAAEKVTVLGGTFAPPGKSHYFVAQLEPGDYVAACFIPVGATPGNEDPTGPPHFTEGMLAEFTVE